jgi:hypothetical protein
MKKKILIISVFSLFTNILLSQQINDSTYVNKNWSYGKCYKMPNNKPANWKSSKPSYHETHYCLPTENNTITEQAEQTTYTPCIKDCGNLKAGITVQIGNNFEGNHMVDNPQDNEIAVSNDGIIVNADNATITYFKENGDTIVKFGLKWEDFYNDSTIAGGQVFDPRVSYDSYYNRFILINIFKTYDYTDSRIILSFSDSLTPDTVTWNHYYIHCDSVFQGIDEEYFWFDYPNLAINKDESFVTCNIFNRDTAFNINQYQSTVLFQLNKQDGYQSNAIVQRKDWKNILNADGDPARTVVPLSDGLQLNSYKDKLYFVSNNSKNSSRLFWYELSGNINDTTAQINSHFILSPSYYATASYASQMGGNAGDRIILIDCRIQHGYYQNGKLHFVFHRSDNGWMEVVYDRISISNNTIVENTWGGNGTNNNYLYPSIANFGVDSTDENSMISFQRTGPNNYIQIGVVNYDNGWSPQTTIVKEGVGLLNRINYGGTSETYERLGDYTDIQRRYNKQSCWLTGSYPYDSTGTTNNHFGIQEGVNTWLAEIGDVGVGISEINQNVSFKIYPNPTTGNQIYIESNDIFSNVEIILTDISGKIIVKQIYNYNNNMVLNLPKYLSGMYFLTIKTKSTHYETYKIIINN